MHDTKNIYQAGADLSHIRAVICRELRNGTPKEELEALLKAEEMAMQALTLAMMEHNQ
jgi:hypothetical protein